jgi:prepilin-type N-terminal cleavage/methylation domain-containing protein
MASNKRWTGFSLIELLIVMAVLMVFGAMVTPIIRTAVDEYKMRSSTVDVNSLLQRARMRSLRDNRAYTIATGQVTAGGASFTRLTMTDVAGNAIARMPSIQLQRGVQPAAGNFAQISNAALGFTPQAAGVAMSFNGRGTPCVVRNGICGSWDAAGQEVGFVYYLQYTLANGAVRMAAVSVSPSGRMRDWKYSGGNWSY